MSTDRPLPPSPRRKFIKWVSLGAATSIISGKLWQRDLLAYCPPDPGQPEGIFKIRLSDYFALSQPYGSVRLGVNPVTDDGHPLPIGNYYPILINRDASGNLHVLDCECRHESCVVPPFDVSEFCIRCECHGSTYWIDGSVLTGPTTMPLGAYQFEFDGTDTLTIHIPCWTFSLAANVLPGGPGSRIRIDFTASPNVQYEVSFRQKTTGPWTPASFATTPTGPPTQTSVLLPDGGDVSVYIPRTTSTGFYAVGMRLGEV